MPMPHACPLSAVSQEKYRAAFTDQTLATKYDFSSMGWNAETSRCLFEVLGHCKLVEELLLGGNKLGDAGAAKLAGIVL